MPPPEGTRQGSAGRHGVERRALQGGTTTGRVWILVLTRYGEVDGRDMYAVAAQLADGARATVAEYGARLHRLPGPRRLFQTADQMLG